MVVAMILPCGAQLGRREARVRGGRLRPRATAQATSIKQGATNATPRSRDRLQNIPPHGRCTHRWKCRRRRNNTGGPLLLLCLATAFLFRSPEAILVRVSCQRIRKIATGWPPSESAWIGFTCPFWHVEMWLQWDVASGDSEQAGCGKWRVLSSRDHVIAPPFFEVSQLDILEKMHGRARVIGAENEMSFG
ncbi:hypothetical protein PVAP13_3NG182344 [Panicum virgatum]|uniref:Uncharacterized protein n=1 Tax=Panicum virgatum TaxID=38727 RepID=A0A8T0U9A7_PANVG|nr:hypothetical protein PVAP13_3NG182344 [Panicum virgatum]